MSPDRGDRAAGEAHGEQTTPSMWSINGPDGRVATGWFLMPLRLFLGVTFLFAGVQKLANPQFFKNSSPTSIHAQLVGAARSSPIHALVSHLVSIASPVGLVIAIGEVAIGVGILVGLFVRVAAGAGMLLSFGLFLTVSFHASPYFTGSDIVFFFAWTPLVLAGAGGAPALDTWLADRSAKQEERAGAVPRRAVLSTGALAAITAALVVVTGGVAAALGRAVGGTSDEEAGGARPSGGESTTTSTTTPVTTTTVPGAPVATTPATSTTTPAGKAIGSTASVPVGGSATFTLPSDGDPGLVLQPASGEFVAFDAVCPHAGCTVAYAAATRIIACPCHGSEFNAKTGAVIRGPATRGLTVVDVVSSGGNLYVPE